MKIEVRSDCIILDGYVNAVGRDSRVITTPNGKFVEQIAPGTFKKAIERATNIVLLLNHKKDRKLGSTEEQTVELFEDNIGLRAICTVRDKEVMEKGKQNKLKGWSFGMHVLNEAKMEERAEGVPRRHVTEIELEEISIIDDQMVPVYFGTSVEVRAEEDVLTETRSTEFVAKVQDDSKVGSHVDYSDYESRIQKLKK